MSSGVDIGLSGGSVWNGVVDRPQYLNRAGASSKRPEGVPYPTEPSSRNMPLAALRYVALNAS